MTNQELDIGAIWAELWRKKWIVIGVTAIFAVASVLFALSLPNKYRSTTVLASAKSDSSSSLASLAGQFSGLANLAGINLGSGGNIFVVMEQIKSKSFVNHFVKKRGILVPLFAARGWDPASGELSYEGQKLYDMQTKQWIRKVKLPLKPEPSEDEIYEKFMDHFKIERDRKTKIISASFEFVSPVIAQQWLKWYIDDLNEYVRDEDLVKVNSNLEYLLEQVKQTEVVPVQTVLYNLIEEQMKKKMLSEVQEEYALTIVDQPSLSMLRSSPRRGMIAIGGTFFGGFMIVGILVLLLFYRHEKKSDKKKTLESHQTPHRPAKAA